MFQIGEFSKICQVSVKTLRHYDKVGLLAPAKVDPITGYRYYGTEQIDVMNHIKRLKRYGFSLEEIGRLTDVSDPAQLAGALRRQREKLKRAQQEADAVLGELWQHIFLLERTGSMMDYQKGYEVVIKNSPELHVLACRARMGVDEFGTYYGKLYERAKKERVALTGLSGARYFDEEFNRESSDIEVFIAAKGEEGADLALKPQECAMTVHRGGYSNLSEAYGAVAAWILEHGYEIAGAPFDLYTKTRFEGLSPEDWETEVYFPVHKK